MFLVIYAPFGVCRAVLSLKEMASVDMDVSERNHQSP